VARFFLDLNLNLNLDVNVDLGPAGPHDLSRRDRERR